MQNLIDAIVPIIVFIAVISGIINSIKEAVAKNSKPAAPPRAAAQPQQQSRAQQEIAAFLRGTPQSDLAADRGARPARAAQQNQRPRQKSPKNPQGQQVPKSQKPKAVGSGVAAHVDSFIGEHVKSHLGREGHTSGENESGGRVRSHLGTQSSKPVEMSASDTGSQAAEDLLSVLKSRAGVRHAILVNEILARPVALRKR